MTDILEEREKRREQALAALRLIIETLKKDNFIEGGLSLRGNAINPKKLELVIHLKPEDLFIWDEVMFGNEGS